MRLTRASFAVMIKLSGEVDNFQALLEDFADEREMKMAEITDEFELKKELVLVLMD